MPLKPQTILIVEDNEDDYEATKRAFKKTNVINPIERVSSGQGALDFLNDRTKPTPGIILLDLNMPGLDGLMTLKSIKQNQNLKTIPVVILTTSDDERDIQDCYRLGANTYIQKPVNFDGLIEAIKKLKEYWFEIALLPKESPQ